MIASRGEPAAKPDPSSVLTKAVARAAERLDISRALLAKILGVSPPTVTRLYGGEYKLDERRKEYKLEELVAGINSANTHAESDFGKPIGKEIW